MFSIPIEVSKRVKIPFRTECTFNINNRKRSRGDDENETEKYEKYEKYSKIERELVVYRVGITS